MNKNSFSSLIPLTFATCALITACDQTRSTDELAHSAQSTSETSSAPSLAITRISAEEARQTASDIEQQVPITTPEGLKAELWASEKLLGDTVAIHVDDKGRVWAGITQRSNNSEFDIRRVPHWENASMTFKQVEDRRQFLKSELTSENSTLNNKLTDHNEDGIHDWQDLAILNEKVIRLEDTQGSGKADFAQIAVDDFHTEVTDVIGGLFYNENEGELFLNVAPDVWKMKDKDGDGFFEEKKSLANGFAVHIGFSGHGLSGATVGPDGMLYSSMGDIGTSVTDATGKKWNYPDEGVIVRSELDGSNFEVFASGLRNIYEFSFDKFGNFISVDNDGDHIGEYERVVHLIEGSDSGWRINWQLGKYKDPKNNRYKVWMDENYSVPQFKGQAAHILPPVASYHAGPSGMAYNPGTALSNQWQDYFFVVEFVGSATQAGINAFSLKPKGASFELADDKNILKGILPTGLEVGPDGALYLSDWIEGWGLKQKGRVWKLDTPETANSAIRIETKNLLAQDFRKFNADQLNLYMEHADMRVRQKAQFALVEKQEQATLEKVAANNKNQFARIHAIWGLGQLLRKNPVENPVLVTLLQDPDSEIRAQSAKVLGDARIASVTEKLISLLTDKNPRVQLYAAQALGRIANPVAIQSLIDMIAKNNDQDVYLRQAGAIALSRIGDEKALANLANHPSEAVRIAAVVALKKLNSPALAGFLQDKSEFVVTNAARAINDDALVTEALPTLAGLLDNPQFINEPLLRRAINANFYSDANTATQAERLIKFAQMMKISGNLRAEAINTLALWNDASVYDRVSGAYRGQIIRPESEAVTALSNGYKKLLSDKSTEVREAAIGALNKLNLQIANQQLIDLLKKDSAENVRVAALQALKKFNHPEIGELIFIALKDKSQTVRMTGLGMIPDLDMPVAQKVDMHNLLLKTGTTGEQQAALLSLANIHAPEAEEIFREQMQRLIDGKLPAEVKLELVTAVEKMGSPELSQLLASYEANKDKNNPVEVYSEAIYGGDADKGMRLFRYSNSTQCVRCHMVGTRGNRVGPELTTIARRLKPEQMLEAMIAPAARIAPGFGRVTLVLKNGDRIEGAFDSETEENVTITSEKTQTIPRSDIAKMEFNGISPMPPMGQGLSKAELRDLVAYLSTLKDPEEPEGH
jgi:quinoprotein glucose dehydrogenase